jgi:hypothetical protein
MRSSMYLPFAQVLIAMSLRPDKLIRLLKFDMLLVLE